ncbi:hypothetical protein [Streptomyces sp. NPDC094031]|uniref:hypothetical protein n=1 Tax=Streptomyces sp. NPDC094031 TaxID=3155307 RepID=UPI00332C8FFD
MDLPLPETLQRLRRHAGEQALNPQELAADTALPEAVVALLLEGDTPPADTVDERVCARVKVLADAHMSHHKKRLSDLVREVQQCCGISDVWARKVLQGDKVPSVSLLHHLADFFKVEGGESFFTASSADALNRVLLTKLSAYEDPNSDPIRALMNKHGIVSTDLRMHGHQMSNGQMEQMLADILRSVINPPDQGQR